MARVRYMKNSLDYVHFNNYLHTPKTFYFCIPLLTSSQPVITIYYCVSYQGLRNMGVGGAIPPLDFDKLVNPIYIKGWGSIPLPRIFRPSYGLIIGRVALCPVRLTYLLYIVCPACLLAA